MYNKCGGKAPQFPQMTIYDSLALADVPFGIQRIFHFSQRCSVYESRSLAKTGSGQTQRKSSNKTAVGVYVQVSM
jgi:hypothetical protein